MKGTPLAEDWGMGALRYGLMFVAVAVGSACGGTSTFTPGEGGSGSGRGGGSGSGGTKANGGGSGGSGGTGGGSGGTAAGGGTGGAGGSGGSGGTGVGGAGGGGGVGGASTAGAGGTGQAGAGATSGAAGMAGACGTPPDLFPGECGPMVYHDPETGECTPGAPYQCLGNANRFSSIAECLAACPGSKPSMFGCDTPTDCIVGSTGCCGLCPDAPFDSAKGINGARALAGDYRPCGDVACEPCAEVPPVSQTTQYYLATCEARKCGVVDLRTTPSTECETDQDCFLRAGIDCCPACSATSFAALSSTDFLNGRCTDIGCPECVTPVPDNLFASCLDGRCIVDEPVPSN